MSIVDKFPEDGVVLGLVLLLDLVYSIVRDSVFLGTYNSMGETCEAYRNSTSSEILDETLEIYRNETYGNGLGGIIVFSGALSIFVITFIVVVILHAYALLGNQDKNNKEELHYSPLLTLFTCCKQNGNRFVDHSHMSYTTSFIQCLLVTMYFIGDNLGPLIEKHGADLDCVDECSDNVLVVTKVISVATALLLHLVPYLLHHCVKAYKTLEYEIEEEKTLLGLLGNIVKVDATYTAITASVGAANYCSVAEEALNWIILIFCVFGGAAYITLKMLNSKDNMNTCALVSLAIGGSIYMMVLLFLYLSSDNDTPLDCSFHSDDNEPDATHPLLERHCCNIHGNIVTRLVFSCVALVMTIIVAAVVAGVQLYHAKKIQKIDPVEIEMKL